MTFDLKKVTAITHGTESLQPEYTLVWVNDEGAAEGLSLKPASAIKPLKILKVAIALESQGMKTKAANNYCALLEMDQDFGPAWLGLKRVLVEGWGKSATAIVKGVGRVSAGMCESKAQSLMTPIQIVMWDRMNERALYKLYEKIGPNEEIRVEVFNGREREEDHYTIEECCMRLAEIQVGKLRGGALSEGEERQVSLGLSQLLAEISRFRHLRPNSIRSVRGLDDDRMLTPLELLYSARAYAAKSGNEPAQAKIMYYIGLISNDPDVAMEGFYQAGKMGHRGAYLELAKTLSDYNRPRYEGFNPKKFLMHNCKLDGAKSALVAFLVEGEVVRLQDSDTSSKVTFYVREKGCLKTVMELGQNARDRMPLLRRS